jgi:hypothetical protein
VNENITEFLEEYYVENANVEKDKRFGKKIARQKEAEGTEKRKMRKRRKAKVFNLFYLNYFISLSEWCHLFCSPLKMELPLGHRC